MAKKQKSIKKQAKTNKGKFGLKKLDFKKNWKKLSYLGLSGFLVIASLSYGGWKLYQQNNASAWRMTFLTRQPVYLSGSSMNGCKIKAGNTWYGVFFNDNTSTLTSYNSAKLSIASTSNVVSSSTWSNPKYNNSNSRTLSAKSSTANVLYSVSVNVPGYGTKYASGNLNNLVYCY
jgi:hypothetical protein